MHKTWIGAVSTALLALALAACGGGDGNRDRCGAQEQGFGISITPRTQSLKVNQAAGVRAEVFPESCRSDITFELRNGALPPGMSIDKGNVIGTPTRVGSYSFEIYIVRIDNYETVHEPPHTGLVRLNVLP